MEKRLGTSDLYKARVLNFHCPYRGVQNCAVEVERRTIGKHWSQNMVRERATGASGRSSASATMAEASLVGRGRQLILIVGDLAFRVTMTSSNGDHDNNTQCFIAFINVFSKS